MSELLFPAFLAVAQASEPSSDPALVVDAFLDAMSRGDLDRAERMLHDRYVFRDEEGTFSVAKDAVRPMLAWDRATRARVKIVDSRIERDRQIAVLREHNDFLELLGAPPLVHEVTFVVEDGLLAATILGDSGDFMERVEAALEPVVEWARASRPDALEGILGDSGPVYSGDSAERWLALLREAHRARVLPRRRAP